MAILEFKVKKYRQEGDMQHTYSPLKNILKSDNSICEFNTDELDIDLNHPLTIDCQPSYDGTVNLIINDDKNPPRMINTRFSRIENNRYRIITRNQLQQTNLYKESKIDQQTRLFRNINSIPKFDLIGVDHFGQLTGGNYTFYVKLSDEDSNQTDVAAESSQISIFHGDFYQISSVSGTLQDERTDKSIKLKISNIDTSFSQLYLYYTREYCDQNGIRMVEAKSIVEPYPIKQTNELITITGYEDVVDIPVDEINIKYNTAHAVKTQTQVQNRLFFGNIQESSLNVAEIQNLSYYIDVQLKQKEESIGYINHRYDTLDGDNINKLEYYSPQNIYYNLGYWPDEIYRLGIVYILNDDSLTPVFNLRGCDFSNPRCESNIIGRTSLRLTQLYNINDEKNYLERDTFLDDGLYLDNTFGVFKNPKISLYQNNEVKPLYYRISISSEILKELYKQKIKGYFIVRQKRIPTILGQGLSIGIDKCSYTPMLKIGKKDGKDSYISESFLNKSRILTTDVSSRLITTELKQSSALLCLDANVTPAIQSMLDGSTYVLEQISDNISSPSRIGRHYYINNVDHYASDDLKTTKAQAIFVNSDTPLKWVHEHGFSTRAGSMSDVKTFSFFGEKEYGGDKKSRLPYLRGIYCPFVGITSSLEDNSIYNIRVKEYSEGYMKEYFQIRGNDNSPFYSVSDRYELNLNQSGQVIDVYRGDCFTNTVTIRLNRNFTDADVPINEIIIDPWTWKDSYNGFLNTKAEDWSKINRADLNTVPLGIWITFKCLSSYNLGLRSFDRNYPDEQALLGNPRGYYPINDISTSPALKIEESWLLNDGYNATVGRKSNSIVQNVPYINDLFDNRIMFSNAQVDSAFKNAYRIFQGLSYGDIDRQCGAIVKLIPWETNLFCVFEHGLAIVPVNEKALIQTTTGQSVHMYGAGVIQNQISLISPDFGSIWQESVIQTPIGIYGVDTYAKKIWRFTRQNGLETISDMKIQRFLNDNILLKESDKYPIIALRNVKSHYNNYKGDVMFTFYNYSENKEWNFCFNERMNKWITRYSWTPLYSENINNTFYSLDKKRAEILSYIYNNRHSNFGIHTDKNEWTGSIDQNGLFNLEDSFVTNITYIGSSNITDFKLQIEKVESSDIQIRTDFIHLTKCNNKYTLSINKAELENNYESIPMYFKIYVKIQPISNSGNQDVYLMPVNGIIGIVVDQRHDETRFRNKLLNGFYVHGRSGIIDEINYFDENPDNQIKPTLWYDKQEPFEFEFVVNEPVGLHKIFNNLVIISNNVQPSEFEFEIIGDVYDFKKSGIYKTNGTLKDTTVKYDPILNQYTLLMNQKCKNIEKYGRRLGNIHYKEDSWYYTIEPIICNGQSARIRDKFIKIRVKYSGKDQVIITSLKTMFTLSYS